MYFQIPERNLPEQESVFTGTHYTSNTLPRALCVFISLNPSNGPKRLALIFPFNKAWRGYIICLAPGNWQPRVSDMLSSEFRASQVQRQRRFGSSEAKAPADRDGGQTAPPPAMRGE